MPSTPDELFLSFQAAVAGRYSLDRELGRGGMGVVYLAREVHLDRPVAIKLLPPERSAQRALKDRFLREARLAAKLSHPNIIPIHSVEEIGGFVFFVMSFVDGETLAHRVRTRGPLPTTEGARVLREVAWALAYAHEQGLIHRDVKPDNILMEEATGRVMVADFGIAAAAGDSSDGITGTPEFMSPEQALGTQLDARSDLYGLGATAFYAFSGRFPFDGKTPTEVLAKQVTVPAPPLASLGLSVPRKIASLVDRCLAKAPDQRPESAHALAEQLGVALERRREMPAALRNFVKRTARLDGPGTLLAAGLLSVSTTVGGLLLWGGSPGPGLIALAASAALIVAAPFAALADAARDLLKKGYSHRDVGPAFDAVLEQAREELVLETADQRVRVERVLGGLTVAGFGLVLLDALIRNFRPVLSFFLSTVGRYGTMVLDAVAIMAGAVGLFAGIGYAVLRGRRVEPEGSFWAKVWKGAIGRAAFAVAAKFVHGHRMTMLTHQATEFSLGMAAEHLYESLPKDVRGQLTDLPATLRHLQDTAQELRKRHEALEEALADAGDAGAGAEYADVRAMRDTLHDKLAATVGALETIRLNLLRLHAGAMSVESVTTYLGLAADVAEDIERLITAHTDVENMLKFPRTPDATPV